MVKEGKPLVCSNCLEELNTDELIGSGRCPYCGTFTVKWKKTGKWYNLKVVWPRGGLR